MAQKLISFTYRYSLVDQANTGPPEQSVVQDHSVTALPLST